MSDSNAGYPNYSSTRRAGPGGVTKGRWVKFGTGPNADRVIACTNAAVDADPDALLAWGVAYQSADEGADVLIIREGAADVEVYDDDVLDGDQLTIDNIGRMIKQAAEPTLATLGIALEFGQDRVPASTGRAAYAKVLIRRLPPIPLPVEEEGGGG